MSPICDYCGSATLRGVCPVCRKGQRTLRDHWEVTKVNIKRNTKARADWKAILGMTLTRACSRFRIAGMNARQTYKAICYEHDDLSEELKRRLWIGITARFSESGTYDEELRRNGRLKNEPLQNSNKGHNAGCTA